MKLSKKPNNIKKKNGFKNNVKFKSQIEKLAEKDPEFYKYLKKDEADIFEFSDDDELFDEDKNSLTSMVDEEDCLTDSDDDEDADDQQDDLNMVDEEDYLTDMGDEESNFF